MALAPRLDLRQTQSLVMTPQLQQAIKLLALSNMELEAFIGTELEKNPLLESSAADPDPVDRSEAPVESPDGMHAAADGETVDRLLTSGAAQSDAPLDHDHASEDYASEARSDRSLSNAAGGSSAESSAFGDDGTDFDSFACPEESLCSHLMAQASAALSGIELVIAGQLIGQIDDAGYLEADLLDLAWRLSVPRAQVERVLSVIQTFDPVGVGARSLAECIAIQAREADRYDPAMARLIDNLDLLARGALPQLRRICGVDEEDMADMIRELRSYDPKPGQRFGGTRPPDVVPDIFVNRTKTGWTVELNSATLPRVLVNRDYYVELARGAQDGGSKSWLADCLASANWLVKALDQRQRTIIKVASEIVKHQEGFFEQGVAHMRPLTLKTVADAIGMHESTVSRVTSNKYLSCTRGVFELKYFFTSGIQSADGGEAASAEAVKSHIKTLIDQEQPGAILSDDTLVDLLRERGFDIARRTVAKYREAMGIGSSVQRRRQKALAGA